MQDAVDEVRRDETRAAASDEERKQLKGARWSRRAPAQPDAQVTSRAAIHTRHALAATHGPDFYCEVEFGRLPVLVVAEDPGRRGLWVAANNDSKSRSALAVGGDEQA